MNSGEIEAQGWVLPKVRGGARAESVGSAHKLPPSYTEMLPTPEPCKSPTAGPTKVLPVKTGKRVLSVSGLREPHSMGHVPSCCKKAALPFPSLSYFPLTVQFQPNSVYFSPVCSVHFSPLPQPALSASVNYISLHSFYLDEYISSLHLTTHTHPCVYSSLSALFTSSIPSYLVHPCHCVSSYMKPSFQSPSVFFIGFSGNIHSASRVPWARLAAFGSKMPT